MNTFTVDNSMKKEATHHEQPLFSLLLVSNAYLNRVNVPLNDSPPIVME